MSLIRFAKTKCDLLCLQFEIAISIESLLTHLSLVLAGGPGRINAYVEGAIIALGSSVSISRDSKYDPYILHDITAFLIFRSYLMHGNGTAMR